MRSCRRLFSNIKSLGGHFGVGCLSTVSVFPFGNVTHCSQSAHNSTLLNDNRDGTLSVIGNYTVDKKYHRPPVIRSKKAPLSSEAKPMAEPSLSTFASKALQAEFAEKMTHFKRLQPHADSRHDKTMDEIMAEELSAEVSEAVAEHSESELSDLVSIPNSTFSSESATDSDGSGSDSESDETEAAEQSAPPEATATGDAVRDRLLDDAELTPAELGTWNLIRAHFTRKIIQPPQDGPLRELLSRPRQRDLVANKTFSITWPKDALLLIVQYNGEESPRPCSRCEEGRGVFNVCVMLTKELANILQAGLCTCVCCAWKSSNLHRCNLQKILRELRVDEDSSTTISSVTHPRRPHTLPSSPVEAPVSHDEVDSQDAEADHEANEVNEANQVRTRHSRRVLQMGAAAAEDAQPLHVSGRARDVEVDKTNFSTEGSADGIKVLSHSTKVDKHFTYEICVMPPKTALRLEADWRHLRICTLASGKISVNVQDEAAFKIGPQGVFKLAPGVSGGVLNVAGVDAVLHISSLVARAR